MRDITALIKPASSMCNLQCSYCFYCDEAEKRSVSSFGIMTKETALNLIKKVYSYSGKDSEINFMFQGGEPLLAGIDFFDFFSKNAVELLPENASLTLSLQTNGTLIDDEFCKLFNKYNYLIGLSIDGKKELHDKQRNNSYDKAIKASELLKKYDVEFNILSVVTSETNAESLYDFCKENNFNYLQTIFCLEPLDGKIKEYNPDPRTIARFKKRLFNKWLNDFKNDIDFSVREIDNIIMYLTTGECEQCGMNGYCTPQLVVEADGTTYPCDFYCIDEYKCKNVNESSLDEIIKCSGMKKFLKSDTELNELCNTCGFFEMCGGCCKRYRNLFNQLKGYCPQKDYLDHVISKLEPYLSGE